MSERVPGLDALRALAVVAVVAYHLAVPHLAGGFLGVTLFFVISGYLITRLLLAELARRGHIDLRGFWVRRLRRLLPAVHLLILACLTAGLLVAPDAVHRYRGDALAALTYSSNWWMIFHHISYFDTYALPSPMTHLWTLAIEEQFYVAWPVVLVVLLVCVRRKGWILTMLLGAVAASSTLMATLYRPDDTNRAYMGTDTRLGELLLGAALAIWLHHPASDRTTRVPTVRWAPAIFLVSAATFVTLNSVLTDQGAFAYRGGILLAALAGAGMILGLQSPAVARPAAALDRGVVGALGRRSYSIYLWHYPILIALSTPWTMATFSLRRTVIAVTLTTVAAEASYRLVEGPIRRLGFRRSFARVYAHVRRRAPLPRFALGALGISALLLPALVLSGVAVPPPADQGPTTFLAGSHPQPSPQPSPLPTAERRAQPRPHRQASDAHGPLRGSQVVAIGDSLMIDIARLLQQHMPGITIDAQVGRQPWTALDIATAYDQFNRPGGAYLLGIGTNGAISTAGLVHFVRSHQSAIILLITPHVPRSWEGASIDAIWQVAHQFANVRVVDFHGASAHRPDYFGPDGVHLTAAGARAMVALIMARTGSRHRDHA